MIELRIPIQQLPAGIDVRIVTTSGAPGEYTQPEYDLAVRLARAMHGEMERFIAESGGNADIVEHGTMQLSRKTEGS